MPLTFEDIQKLCNNFINDYDTILGMENDWADMLVDKIELDASEQEIMQALKVDSNNYIVPVPVKFVYYDKEENRDVYVAIYDRYIMVSTRACYL